MGTPMKHLKETENRMHEQLYQNILLLTYVYPTNKDFDFVFKKDMFVKNNKAAFQQVIYYLLNILNPDLTKRHITTWPPYDVKLENKFRNEVLAYVNQLNLLYPDANIPNIMASHLISPGGYKFVKFMLKLSQFVLFEHLKKNELFSSDILLPIKNHKSTAVTNIITKNITEKTHLIETETAHLLDEFNRNYESIVQEAGSVIHSQTQLNNDLNEISRDQNTKDILEGSTLSAKNETLTQRINKLQGNINDIEQIKNLCVTCDELITCLTDDNFHLKHNKAEVANLNSTNNENEKLDLHQFFSGLNVLLENENLEMPIFTPNQLTEMIATTESINETYSQLDQELTLRNNELVETANKDIFNSEINKRESVEFSGKKMPVIQIGPYVGDDSLARPLEESV